MTQESPSNCIWITHDRYGFSLHLEKPTYDKITKVFYRRFSVEINSIKARMIPTRSLDELRILKKKNWVEEYQILIKPTGNKKMFGKADKKKNVDEEAIRTPKVDLDQYISRIRVCESPDHLDPES